MRIDLSGHLAHASRLAAAGDYETCGRIAQLVNLVVARDEEIASLRPPAAAIDPLVDAEALEATAIVPPAAECDAPPKI